MKKNYHKVMFLVIMALALTVVVGCLPTQMNGGGWIPSTSCDTDMNYKANFGFWGNSCDSNVIGNFNFLDMHAEGYGKQGVKLNGAVTDALQCQGSIFSNTGPCASCNALTLASDFDDLPNVYAIAFNYDSTNPNNRGSGEGFACLVNNGEGANAEADEIYIEVTSGPYGKHKVGRHWKDGYINMGHIQGNISTRSCPDLD